MLPTPHGVALSVPAPGNRPERGQIVVSQGIVDTFPDELHAVLRHEAAHLAHLHHRHLLVAAMVDHTFGWLPLARRSTATLRLALERWADEDAGAAIGRDVVRGALLAATAHRIAEPTLAAFSAAETICERLDALDRDIPHLSVGGHVLIYMPGVALGTAALAAFASWTNGASAVLAMAGQCA